MWGLCPECRQRRASRQWLAVSGYPLAYAFGLGRMPRPHAVRGISVVSQTQPSFGPPPPHPPTRRFCHLSLDVRSFSRRFLKFATPICTGFQVLNRHIWVSRELPWRPGSGDKRRVARNRAKWPGYPHMWGAISETRSKMSERRVYRFIVLSIRNGISTAYVFSHHL